MITLYLAPTCMGARRHQESLVSSLHLVIRILSNPMCVFKIIMIVHERSFSTFTFVLLAFSFMRRGFNLHSKLLFNVRDIYVMSIRISHGINMLNFLFFFLQRLFLRLLEQRHLPFC